MKTKTYRPILATVIFSIIAIVMTFLLALDTDTWVKVAASIVQILLILCISAMAIMGAKVSKINAKTKKGDK